MNNGPPEFSKEDLISLLNIAKGSYETLAEWMKKVKRPDLTVSKLKEIIED